MKHIALALSVSLLATPAAALSCLTPDVAREFQRIAASEKTYVVLEGRFEFAERPPREDTQTPKDQSFLAAFSGNLLTGNGFTDPVENVPVTINSLCSASWCGEILPDTPYLVLVEQDGRNLALQAEACPTNAFQSPSEEMITQIEQCASGGACEAPE